MSLRLIQVLLPAGVAGLADDILDERKFLHRRLQRDSDGRLSVRILVKGEHAESVLDELEKRFLGFQDFRIVVLPVEATIPRPPPEEPAEPKATSSPISPPEEPSKTRISRAELYSDVEETLNLSPVFFTLVVLSSIVAAIGLSESNMAVIIGAMVIAPLLGPNVALALATTLADAQLAKRAVKAAVASTVVVVALALPIGILWHVDPSIPEIALRTRVSLADVALALAAGAAATLSFTTGVSSALIGVMVAVALLPPGLRSEC
jgi:uncharacterized hydrophobic protein (TIGR00341 family)